MGTDLETASVGFRLEPVAVLTALIAASGSKPREWQAQAARTCPVRPDPPEQWSDDSLHLTLTRECVVGDRNPQDVVRA
jgi:hypothetical protein